MAPPQAVGRRKTEAQTIGSGRDVGHMLLYVLKISTTEMESSAFKELFIQKLGQFSKVTPAFRSFDPMIGMKFLVIPL